MKWQGLRETGADVVVVGGGLIGLSIALELEGRGASVLVLDAGRALGQASRAAAGMLAAADPHNPAELKALAEKSVGMYPAYLAEMARRGGVEVPVQTRRAVQWVEDGPAYEMEEMSIDPRQLAEAVLAAVKAAVRASRIELVEGARVSSVREDAFGVRVRSADEREWLGASVVHAAGAWSPEMWSGVRLPVVPRKGQMMRVRMPEGLGLEKVYRSEEVYVVPRRFGEQAGTALIGATVEDVGFDTTVVEADQRWLRAEAAGLVPELASEEGAPCVEAWAGLRPATPDLLPVIGRVERTRQFVATGHYRNGILLAPATARVMAELVEERAPSVALEAFGVGRFAVADPRQIARPNRYSRGEG
jgi:glycine oxidase